MTDSKMTYFNNHLCNCSLFVVIEKQFSSFFPLIVYFPNSLVAKEIEENAMDWEGERNLNIKRKNNHQWHLSQCLNVYRFLCHTKYNVIKMEVYCVIVIHGIII